MKSSTISQATDALASTLGETLLPLAPEQFSALQPFVPDTPWTTTAIHVLQRKQGRVFVDSIDDPQNVVVIAQGDAALKTLDQAFLFGSPDSESLRAFVQAIRGPMEIVCDDEAAKVVQSHHPEARRRDAIVHWFDRLEVADAIQTMQGPRRLRIAESEQIQGLVPGWALRTFRNVKELVTGGTCYVVEDSGAIAAAAFTVDQSVKYERISCATLETARKQGFGSRAFLRVARAVADQGRIPCVITDRRDPAGLRLAEKAGFDRRALMSSFVTSFRK